MSAPFSLSLRRSRLLCAALLALHALPLICGLFAGMSRFGLICLGVAVLVSAAFNLFEARRLAGMRLTLVPHGLSVLVRGERTCEVDVLPASSDLGWLVVIVWRELATGKQGRAALTRDSVPGGEWRALRRYLRWELVQSS